MTSLVLFASLAIGQLTLPDRVVVERNVLVPRVIYEEVKVYDSYKVVLVPETSSVSVPKRNVFKFRSKTKWRVR